MSRAFRHAVSDVLLAVSALLIGCGSALPPPRLSSAEHARVRFMDVFRREGCEWRAVSAQETVIQPSKP